MPNGGFWWAMALELLGLLAFVLFFNLFVPNLGSELGTGGRIALGLVLALVPAALWLAFFLGLDRREPEPKQLVVRTLLTGAIVYAALAGPLFNGIFGIQGWLHATLWSRLLGGILVVGVLEQLIVYVAVRYTIFERPEFNERVDGVIYGVAAGLGVATAVNLAYVFERGGVDLAIGSVRMVINTLAYGAIAGVLGYAMGQARFRRVPIWYLPAALMVTALLNGLLFFLLEGTGSGLQAGGAWGDLAMAAAVAVLALASVFGLVARAQHEPASAPAPAPRPVAPLPVTPPVRRAPLHPGVVAPIPVTAAIAEPEIVAEVEPPPDDDAESTEAGTLAADATQREAQG
ncbi:MAG: PrsW family intramembrane metalloprotease [Caldilineaceae bacterium]